MHSLLISSGINSEFPGAKASGLGGKSQRIYRSLSSRPDPLHILGPDGTQTPAEKFGDVYTIVS